MATEYPGPSHGTSGKRGRMNQEFFTNTEQFTSGFCFTSLRRVSVLPPKGNAFVSQDEQTVKCDRYKIDVEVSVKQNVS